MRDSLHEYSSISGDSDGCWAVAISLNVHETLDVYGVFIDTFGIASPSSESLSAFMEVVLESMVDIFLLTFHFMHHVFLDFMSNLFHSASSGSSCMFSLVFVRSSFMTGQMSATSFFSATTMESESSSWVFVMIGEACCVSLGIASTAWLSKLRKGMGKFANVMDNFNLTSSNII